MKRRNTAVHTPLSLVPGQGAPRLYDRVVEMLRARHYSRRTEKAYVQWMRHHLHATVIQKAIRRAAQDAAEDDDRELSSLR